MLETGIKGLKGFKGLKGIKRLTNSMDVKDYEEILNKKKKLYIKSLKSENPEDELIYKNYKKLLEKLGKTQAKFVIRKTLLLLQKHKDN